MSYEERTPLSRALHERAMRVLPAGVSYQIRSIEPHPFYVKEAGGARITDVDGNVYTDYWMGHGALILGHSPPSVMDAVLRQLGRGTHFGFAHELEVQTAERIADQIPSAEMVRFTNSGTEANMYATRLARAYTGRDRICKTEGGWHGGYDTLHKAVHPPFDVPESAGLDERALENTASIPFNDLDAAAKEARDENLAYIIVEPVMGAAGFITPMPGYLQGLREICDDTGTLLIFDEVVTGFRMSPGGAQEYYGVSPDITVIGKILGGGFPIGAFCGRRDIFELIDHTRFPARETRSAHGGTFTGNPISLTAGLSTLDELDEGVYRHINNLGEKMRNGLQEICDRYKPSAAVTGVASMFALHFQDKPPKNAGDLRKNNLETSRSYYRHMLERNVAYMSATISHCWIGQPHTAGDIVGFLKATEDFFKHYT